MKRTRSERELWLAIQSKVGATPDGDPGPRTATSIAKFLQITDPTVTRAVAQANWPRDRNSDLIAHYGEPGSNQVRLQVPYPMRLAWDMNTELTSFYCHKKVARPLGLIFDDLLAHYGLDQIQKLRLDRFGGCLNVRRKRGGTSWSTHAFGAAVDLDPDQNKLRWNQSKAAFAGPDYSAMWQIVENHGATSLGRKRDYDWMHFQFASTS